jgi:hypothetical protein
MTASAALLTAFVEDGITFGQDKQQLVGVLERIRLFAPPEVVVEAEQVLQSILEIALQPVIDFHGITADDMAKRRESNVLQGFSKVCRSDLDGLHLKVR